MCIISNKRCIHSNQISLNSDRRRFVTMWRYNFDDAFHRAVKAYTKHQKLLDFWILSTKMSKKIIENGPQCFIPRELVIFEFFLFECRLIGQKRSCYCYCLTITDTTESLLVIILLTNDKIIETSWRFV